MCPLVLPERKLLVCVIHIQISEESRKGNHKEMETHEISSLAIKKTQPHHHTKNPQEHCRNTLESKVKNHPFSQCLKSKKQGTGRHQMARDFLRRGQNSYVPTLDREDLNSMSETLTTCPRNSEASSAVPGGEAVPSQARVTHWQVTFGRVTLPQGALHNSGKNQIVVTTSFTNRLEEMPAFMWA